MEATRNITTRAVAMSSGCPITPVRITLITASCTAPRAMAETGAHGRGTR